MGGRQFSELSVSGRPTTLAALRGAALQPESLRNVDCLWLAMGLALGEAERNTSRAACLNAATDCSSPPSASLGLAIALLPPLPSLSSAVSMMYVARLSVSGVSCSTQLVTSAAATPLSGRSAALRMSSSGSIDGPLPLSRLGLLSLAVNPESLELLLSRPFNAPELNSAARFE